MKKLFAILLILTTFYCRAQNQKNFAISYGTGKGSFGSFNKVLALHTIQQKSLNIFGIHYWHEMTRNLFLETGIQLINYQYLTIPWEAGKPSSNNSLNLITVPLKLRFEMGKYLYINGGLLADVDKNNNLSGIGTGIGAGLQVKIWKEIGMFLNPQINVHSLSNRRQHFVESNVTFGLSYKLK